MLQRISTLTKLSAGVLLIIPLTGLSGTESDLRQFEEDATQPRKIEKQKNHSHKPPERDEERDYDSSGEASDLRDAIVSAIAEAMFDAVTYPGRYSLERVAPAGFDEESDEFSTTPRTVGEGILPYARLDISYNRVSSTVHAMNARGEVGFGPFGFEVRRASYSESDPEASLDVQQYHLLYRMSLGDHVELDAGMGGYELSGASVNSGNSSTLHLLIYPTEQFGIEIRPSWATINGNGIRDHEAAISYGERFWAVRAGYHWLEGPNSSLNGPFIGGSLRY